MGAFSLLALDDLEDEPTDDQRTDDGPRDSEGGCVLRTGHLVRRAGHAVGTHEVDSDGESGQGGENCDDDFAHDCVSVPFVLAFASFAAAVSP
jgi:hypothetical protein